MLVWSRRHDLLNADLVAPGDVEVVLIEEALLRPKAKIGQADLVGVVGEAGPAEVSDAVVLAVNDELVEVGIAPAEGDLDDGVQLGDGRRIAHQQAVPDQRADSVESDAELVDSRGVGGGHTAPRSSQAAGQGVVPSRERRGTSTTQRVYPETSRPVLPPL